MAEPVSTKEASRFDSIDGLRAIAILMVIAYHFTVRYSPEELHFDAKIAGFTAGREGVYLFFIISGYCIAMTAERSRSAGDFLLRRVSRLVPAFTVCVLLTAFALAVLDGLREPPPWTDVLGNILWLPMVTRVPLVDGVYWSLLVELKFYLIFAILLLVTRTTPRAVVAFACLVAAGTALWAIQLGMKARTPIYPFSGVAQTFFLFPSSWCFLFGLVLRVSPSKAISVAAAVLAAAMFWFIGVTAGASIPRPNLTTSLWMTGIVAVSLLLLPRFNLRLPWALTAIGFISYPLYLLHNHIGIAVIRELAPVLPNPYARIAIAVVVVVALAAVVSVTVEHRFRRPIETGVRWLGDRARRLATSG